MEGWLVEGSRREADGWVCVFQLGLGNAEAWFTEGFGSRGEFPAVEANCGVCGGQLRSGDAEVWLREWLPWGQHVDNTGVCPTAETGGCVVLEAPKQWLNCSKSPLNWSALPMFQSSMSEGYAIIAEKKKWGRCLYWKRVGCFVLNLPGNNLSSRDTIQIE